MHRSWPEEENRQQQRGTKRTRTIQEKNVNVRSQSSDNSDQNNEEDDEVDVPLSKKINRLNIEYSSDQQSSNVENFSDKYPYTGSPYYRPNELLHSLHEERRQRNQQASLHKALNSHLKL